MSSLTDNGLCYTAKHRRDHKPAAFQTNLAALGCHSIACTPYHPQTCGKIERFWQTLKKWLRARERAHGPYRTLAALNHDLALFAEHYNTRRPTEPWAGAPRPRCSPQRSRLGPSTAPAQPGPDLPLPRQHRRHRHRQRPTRRRPQPTALPVGARYKQLPVTVLQDGSGSPSSAATNSSAHSTWTPARSTNHCTPRHWVPDPETLVSAMS